MAEILAVQLLDRDAPVHLAVEGEATLEEAVLIIARYHLHISPLTLNLFGFRQGSAWLAPDTRLRSLVETSSSKPTLQFRLRFKIPGWRSTESCKSLKHVDPVAFKYLYYQVRKDFDAGKVCTKKHSDKCEKWWAGIIQPGGRDRSQEIETFGNVMELVSRNMAIDITLGEKEKKEISSNVKLYIPRDLWSGLEKLMAVKLLHTKVEGGIDKLLKAYKSTVGPLALMEDFLRLTEKYFPVYFHEDFPAHWEDGGRVSEVRLVVTHPTEDKEVELVVLRRVDKEEVQEAVVGLSQICNVALQKEVNLEISRMNGIPLYFSLLNSRNTTSLLTLLCGYYRLAEKWSFSLCTELRFPLLEACLSNKVHGPITKEFALTKLAKMNFKKGSYLVRQSAETQGKLLLLFCSREGCRPEELIIQNRMAGEFLIEASPTLTLPESLYQPFPSLPALLHALKSSQSSVVLLDCVHPSEFDRCASLLLCRSAAQWKADSLGNRPTQTADRLFIPHKSLSRYEGSMYQGRMCNVWKGEWKKGPAVRKTVAIKQLNKELLTDKMTEFLNLATKCMLWDDPSLATVYGCCLPMEEEPPVLVKEYFPYGPLDAYLRERKQQVQAVDLLEAATSLARSLFYLEDQGIVHGDIRCRNMYVAEHGDNVFKVKLGEGGLGGPRKEDVHWLDWHQLKALLASGALGSPTYRALSPLSSGRSCTPGGGMYRTEDSYRIKPSLAADVWSFGTTLWEIFNSGEPPLPGMAPLEAARQYIAGDRLPWPGNSPQLAQVYPLMKECWLPLPAQRKKPQAIMRDMNQLLYKVFNSRRTHEYVSIDSSLSTSYHSSPSTPSTLRYSNQGTADSGGLVPVFTELTRNLFETDFSMLLNFGDTDSTSPLINSSCSSSSLFNTNMSALTCQTSLEWSGAYSISSIYQFEDSQIEYNVDFPLGEGNFGIVYRGVRTKSDGDWEQVAVKMIKDTDTMSQSAVDDMEREVRLMKRLSHDNIVKIRGVSNIRTHTIIVMEFIREGSLDRYLQVNRHTLDYPRQLFGYAQNIADGMEYLTQHKIIHRDLAARNILVADQETVKISDFGLARDATNDYYVMQSTTNIPVKWLALECLTQSKYSHASDVWSFGVTLWEMFAFGQTPSLTGCENFFQHGESQERHRQDVKEWLSRLEQGVRLPQTDYCPNYLYSRVMLACWNKDPTGRPTFTQLKPMLKQAELEAT